jgi:hypothetical protein
MPALTAHQVHHTTTIIINTTSTELETYKLEIYIIHFMYEDISLIRL